MNKSWRHQLVQTRFLNPGIAFFDCRVSMETRLKINARLRTKPWTSWFQLNFNGVTNLIFIDNWKSKFKPFDYEDLSVSAEESLLKVTIVGKFFGEMRMVITANSILSKNILLKLTQCTISFSFPRISFPRLTAQYNISGADWKLIVSPACLDFDESFKKAKAENTQKLWILGYFDRLGLLWPYEEDQTQWLETSLRGLDAGLQIFVQHIDEAYMVNR